MTAKFLHQILDAVHRGNLNNLQDLYNTIKSKDELLHFTKCQYPNGDNPLHIACQKGYLPIVKFLIETWAFQDEKVNCGNNIGKTALHEAAQNCHFQIVDYLLKKDFPVDPLKLSDWTPLMLASTKKGTESLETIKILISHGANLKLTNKDGWACLHLACREGDLHIVDYLLSCYPEAIQMKTKNGKIPLHISTLHGHLDVSKLILSKNKDLLEIKDNCGMTPLHYSIMSGNIKLIENLITNGAKIQATDSSGFGCLHLAVQSGDEKLICYLIETLKMDVNDSKNQHGLSPMHLAAVAKKLILLNC